MVSPHTPSGSLHGIITVNVKDHQGNLTQMARKFSVGTGTTPPDDGDHQGQNNPPVIASVIPPAVDGGDLVTFPVMVSDQDPTDIITLTAIGLPQGATLTKANNLLWDFNWQTSLEDEGDVFVTFIAHDGTENSFPVVVDISVKVEPVVDTTPPSTPESFTPHVLSPTQIDLAWEAATDNVGVTGYRIFHNETLLVDTTELIFSHIDLTPDTTYVYSIVAYDAEGNLSTQTLIEARTEPADEPTDITARLVARDQFNKEISGALVYISQTKEWVTSGTELELPVGDTYNLRGKIGKIKGAWSKVTIDSTMTEVAVPFWTTMLLAQDQTGNTISDATLHLHQWTGAPLTSGSSLTVPTGARISIRGTAGAIKGPWRRVTVTEETPEIILPFLTAPLLAQNQTGQTVPGAQIHVHRMEGSPFTSGTMLTLPKDARVSVRGTLGVIRGPWTKVRFTGELAEVVVPFLTTTLTARDQFGKDVADAQVHVHRVEHSPFPSGSTLTLPMNAKVSVRGTSGAIRGPWERVVINETATEIVVPFWTTTLTARDQFGQNVADAQLHVHRVEHSPFTSGSSLTLPKNARVSVRGTSGAIRGPWGKVVINETVTEIVVPFWTAQLSAQNGKGTDLPQAQLAIHRWEGGFLTPGSSVTLPKGAKASIRGFLETQRSRWTRFRFTDGLTQAVITIGS